MPTSNPNIPQGTLNLLRTSIIWTLNPGLNVSPAFTGKAGVSISFDGDFTTEIETMTGLVQSPEPYVMVTATINLIRTQGLAAAYQSQWQANTVLGDCIIRGDVAGGSGGLASFYINNNAIKGVSPLSFAGKDAGLIITTRGYLNINNSLWSS